MRINGDLTKLVGKKYYQTENQRRGLIMNRPIGVQLEGTIYAKDGDLGHNDFINAFIEFVESKGWLFGGGSFQIDYDGEKIDDID